MEEKNESNAARVLRLHGDDREQELKEARERDEAKISKVSRWENFWYHYKWTVVMVGAFAVIFLVAAFQLLEKDHPDAMIMYAGPSYIGETASRDLKPLLESLAEDVNGDGETMITFYSVVYVPGGTGSSMAMKQFTNEFSVGDTCLFFLSEDMYEVALDTGLLMPLEEIFGKDVPNSAYDGFGIDLSLTDFYQQNEAARLMGERVIVCVKSADKMIGLNHEEATARKETAASMLRCLISWRKEEAS